MSKASIQLSDHFTCGRLIRFTLPSITMMIFTAVYGVVDGFFVSNYAGKTPFAAVNLIIPVLLGLGCVGFMFGTGGSALIAKTMGQGDRERANDIFSMIVYVSAAIGVVLMLFFNSPGKNPFVNFGTGLWDTYNNITGILSDVLSYIRLFAIGLSGGILATVFNDLATGLSPDIPVVRELMILLILLVGHGINLFMSSISSFVHPMRLTFVEFYKNAGFEMAARQFEPLTKIDQSENK